MPTSPKSKRNWASELAAERTPAIVEDGAQRFGRYLLCYELAAGGMGTVYLARALGPAGFDRPVAIKRIHPHLAHQTHLVEMFLDEARIASRINHPNVCSVHDFGEVDGTYYIALEYLLGESVGAVLANMLADPDQLDAPTWQAIAARIIADAAEGLHAAHTSRDPSGAPLNVVHRDVSPPNLFVTYDGAVKVLDFGVARAEGRLHQTETGSVKGKYAYMAPEQVGGKEVDARADVWALGVCLWEMLTGERLFRQTTEMDTILAVRSQTIRAPSEIRPSVPVGLDAIVLQALARDPDERWSTSRELGRALDTHLRTQPEATGLADVADWMQARFAVRREAKHEMVKTVLKSSAGSIIATPTMPLEASSPRLRADRVGDVTPSLDAGRGGPTREGAHTAELQADARAEGAVPNGAQTAKSEGRSARIWVPMLALLLGIGGTLVLTRPDPEASTAPAPEMPSLEVGTIEVDTDQTQPELEPDPRPDLTFELEAEMPARPRMRRSMQPVPMAQMGTAQMQSPVETTGRVNVATPGGWADIHLEGRRIGRTPRGFELPVGRHVIELRPFGEEPAMRVPVSVVSGQTVRVSRRVER